MGTTATPRNRAAIAIACLLALLGFATVVALSVRDADAKSATVLGKTKVTPKSPCPDSKKSADCRITVKVTGIQTRADGQKAPFKVPANGRIVAWSVQVGAVDWSGAPDLGSTLDDKYGASKARLAVLKSKKKHKFKLTKQTPKLDLESRLGSQPIITLDKPLKVKKAREKWDKEKDKKGAKKEEKKDEKKDEKPPEEKKMAGPEGQDAGPVVAEEGKSDAKDEKKSDGFVPPAPDEKSRKYMVSLSPLA